MIRIACRNLTASILRDGLVITWTAAQDDEQLPLIKVFPLTGPSVDVSYGSDGVVIESNAIWDRTWDRTWRWEAGDHQQHHNVYMTVVEWQKLWTAANTPPTSDAAGVLESTVCTDINADQSDMVEQVVRLAGATVAHAEHFDRLRAADTQLRQILADTPVADRHQVAITKERLDQLEADSKALSDLRAGRDVDLSGTRARLIARSDLETLYADRNSLHRLLRGIAAGINHDPELMVTLERWVAEQDTL